MALEFFFNVGLVSLNGNDTIHSYTGIGEAGRHVSSVGFSLLVIRLVIPLIQHRILLALFLLLIVPPLYYTFYSSQEVLVDYVVENTPLETKKSQSYSYIYKRGLTSGALSYNHISSYGAGIHEDKVFKSSAILWGVINPFFIAEANNLTENEILKDTQRVYYNDFLNNNNYYHQGYTYSLYRARKAHSVYTGTMANLEEFGRKADLEIAVAWETKLEHEKRIINRYQSLRKHLTKNRNQALRSSLFRKSAPFEIESLYRSIARTSVQSGFDAINRGLDKHSRLLPEDYRFSSLCTSSRSGSVNTIKFQTVDGPRIFSITSYYQKYTKYKSFTCDVDLRPAQQRTLDRFYGEIRENYGIDDFTAITKAQFANSQASSHAIRNLIYDHSGVLLPENWSRHDKEGFFTAFRNAELAEARKAARARFNMLYGGHIEFGLSHFELYKHPVFIRFLEANAGIFDADGLKDYDHFVAHLTPAYNLVEDDRFIEYYKDSVYLKMADFYVRETQDNETFINSIFTISVVTVFSIFFSLFFMLANLSYIAIDLLKLIGVGKRQETGSSLKARLLFLLVPIVLIVSPYYIDNHYTSSDYYTEQMLPTMKEHNLYTAIAYHWYLNAETLIFSMVDDEWLLEYIPYIRNNSFYRDAGYESWDS
ncbi:hypothetical protein [Vibrio genomosp. F10]|uniref:hypothetical protein n=1 Tax=Vibrio genomosp. F10 TaxID=723171 RepID=UPI00114CBDE9|nr:hypothetical protein [Vibrio genomosp. F10]